MCKRSFEVYDTDSPVGEVLAVELLSGAIEFSPSPIYLPLRNSKPFFEYYCGVHMVYDFFSV